MKHKIKYWNRFPGYSGGDCSQWECEVCHQGPFKPAVVCIQIGDVLTVASPIMYKAHALRLKADLNKGLNQAVYFCMRYEEVLKIRGLEPEELIFDQPGTTCKETM